MAVDFLDLEQAPSTCSARGTRIREDPPRTS